MSLGPSKSIDIISSHFKAGAQPQGTNKQDDRIYLRQYLFDNRIPKVDPNRYIIMNKKVIAKGLPSNTAPNLAQLKTVFMA